MMDERRFTMMQPRDYAEGDPFGFDEALTAYEANDTTNTNRLLYGDTHRPLVSREFLHGLVVGLILMGPIWLLVGIIVGRAWS